MIRIGINAITKYPKISPVRAIPAPWSRPLLLRISEREIWPRMMAAIAAGNKSKPQTPAIKLPMAFPLVSPVSIGNAAGVAVGLDWEVVGAPQRLQNGLFSRSAAPHFEQNIASPC